MLTPAERSEFYSLLEQLVQARIEQAFVNAVPDAVPLSARVKAADVVDQLTRDIRERVEQL